MNSARNAGLAVIVLALVGVGIHALFGEFTHHSWRTAIGKPGRLSRPCGYGVASLALCNAVPGTAGEPAARSVNGSARANDAANTPTWRGLVVAPEHRCSPYERTDYTYPRSVEAQIVAAMGGRVYGPYTGRTFAHTGHTDIEHMVATSEAHDSGLCAANYVTRSAFARDLLNLTLAAPEVNRCDPRGKCGRDAGEWLPARNDCWFADRVLTVRLKYNLTIDRREARALEQVLSNCASTDMMFHGGDATGSGAGQ